jgi:HK97 gp10 family phage protein
MGKWSQSDWQQILEAATDRALPAIGITIEGQAADLAPVITGRLKGSITYCTKGIRSQLKSPAKGNDAVSTPPNAQTLHIGTNVEYAAYLEYGTRRMAAQPYLRPALDMNRKTAQERFSAEIRQAIQNYGK